MHLQFIFIFKIVMKKASKAWVLADTSHVWLEASFGWEGHLIGMPHWVLNDKIMGKTKTIQSLSH